MKDNGKMVKGKDSDISILKIKVFMKELLSKISRTAMEQNLSLMEIRIKDNIAKEDFMEKGSTSGSQEIAMMDNFMRVASMEEVFGHHLLVKYMKVDTNSTRKQEVENTNGGMDAFLKASFKEIKSTYLFI